MRMKCPLIPAMYIATILYGQSLEQMHRSKMNGSAQTRTRIPHMAFMYAPLGEALAVQDRLLIFTKLTMTELFIFRA